MDSPAETASAASGGTKLKAGLLAAALGLAFAGAYYSRPAAQPASAATPAAQTAVEEALRPIPGSTGDAANDKTLSAFIRKVRVNPENSNAWLSLGDMLAQLQRDTADAKYYDYAETAYLRALKLNSNNAGALAGMAWVTGGRHLFDQSIDWAGKALMVDGGNTAAYGIRGDAALELGDYDMAFEQYQKMMDLRPDLSSWSRGAYLLWITGNRSKAMWLMEKAINAGAPFAENTAWCRAKLAMMLFHDGAFVPAAQALEPALTAGSHNTLILLAAGRIAAARQDFPAAIGYYQKILEKGPNHEALAALGDIHAANGEMQEAEQFYLKVEALHAAHLQTGAHDHSAMAKFYADHDRNLVEALRLAEQHKLTRNVLEADALAWVYFKNGDLPKAIEAIKRALKQNTPDAEIRYHAGMIAAAFGDRVSAQKHLQEALNFNPRFNPLQAPVAVKKLEELGEKSPRLAVSPTEAPPAK